MSRPRTERNGGGAWLIVSDAAAKLGVSGRTIERRIRSRKLRSRMREGRREVFVEGACSDTPEVEVTVGGPAPFEATWEERVGRGSVGRNRPDGGRFEEDHEAGSDTLTDTGTDTPGVSDTMSESVSEARRRTDGSTDTPTDSDTDSGGVSEGRTDTVSELSERSEHFHLATLSATRQLVAMCDERLAVADADVRSARRTAGMAWVAAAALAFAGVAILVWATARTTGQGAEIKRLTALVAESDGELARLQESLHANALSYEALRDDLAEAELDTRAAAARADARERLVEALVAERSRLAEALDRTTAERERVTERLARLVEPSRTAPPVVVDPWGVFGRGAAVGAGERSDEE